MCVGFERGAPEREARYFSATGMPVDPDTEQHISLPPQTLPSMELRLALELVGGEIEEAVRSD